MIAQLVRCRARLGRRLALARAKDPDAGEPPLEHYRPLLEAVLRSGM